MIQRLNIILINLNIFPTEAFSAVITREFFYFPIEQMNVNRRL